MSGFYLETLVHIASGIRDPSTIWKILYEALAEYNIFKILYEASAEYNISKIARHTSLEVTADNIVRGFSRVQYCWQSLQAECGVLFWSYCTRRE